jgi:hypothetical protein
MTALPGTPGIRRRLGFAVLAVGAILVFRTIDKDLPREQTLVFRLDDSLKGMPLSLTATITRAGESKARNGFTLTRTGPEAGDPRQTFRAPNGDYVVTIDCNPLDTGEKSAHPAEKRETSSVHRVTLGGGDIVVRIGPRVTE